MADGINVDTGCSTLTVKTKTCRFFQTKKGCKFGDDCRFLHLEKLSNESGSVLHEAGNEDQKKNLKLHNEDNEPFKAERNEMEERKDASSDRQGIVCKFFQRKRGCLRGDKCPFAHVILDGESTLHKSACDKNPGNASERPKKQTTHQGKEIPKPVQEDNATKSTMSGQGSGITLPISSNTTKHAGTGKEAAQHKHKSVGTGTGGKGVSLPNKYNSTNRVKCGKGTPLSKTNNVSKGAETVTGIPLAKKNKAIRGTESATGILVLEEGNAIKGSESRQGEPVLNNDNDIKHEESEKHLPLSQKKNVTHGAVTRQRVPLPDKENVRKHAETGHRVPLHDKDNATNFRGTFTLGDAILSEPKRLRSTEIQQLKRRFGGKGGFSEIKENSSYKIKFKPTDPDWPFKIEAVYLTVCFPDDYPLHIFNVALSEEQDLSQDIINFVTQRIQQWTTLQQEQMGKSQGTLKLYFRPFLRWFDNNLVSLFIDGGKQMRERYVSSISGIDDTACRIPSDSLAPESQDSVISSTPDQEYLQDTSCDGRGSNTGIDWEPMKPTQINKISDGSHLIIKEDSKGLDILCNDAVLSQELHSDTLMASTSVTPDSASGHDANNKTINIDPSCDDNVLDKVPLKQIMETDSRNSNNCEQSFASEHAAQLSQSDSYASGATAERGTQIQFKGLNLEESTSSMRGHKLVITLECNRCKQRIDQQLSASGSVVKQCTRCAAAFAVTYRPAVIHQFSSVLGYLDLDGCVAFDVILPESELMLGCFQCSKETSVKGLQYGANWSWCGHCHQKLRFQIQSTRFQQLQSSASNTAVPLRKNTVSSSSAKTKKQPPSSGMKEGQPLPANGTCKHYKKSYRWLRFPCCGKCYPCDLCHEEEEGHEMKYASRMVCGFCSREQPYSQQPCNGCKASVTKSRSAHWEGGKGCRDKVSMSRNDDQKFRQLGKTTSRKAQKHSEGKGKGHKGN